MNNGQEGFRARRKKTIIVSVLALILIIVVGVWVIASATKSGKRAATVKNETSKTEKADSAQNADKKSDNKTETITANPSTATSPSEQYSAVSNAPAPATAEAAPVVTAKPADSDIPTTGPSEVVFSALMLGVVAGLATLNLQLKERK